MAEHPTNCTCRKCEVEAAYERGMRESVIPSTDLYSPDPRDLPPKWITDTYGLALMMIREGCADPRRVAAEALAKGENDPDHRTGARTDGGSNG